MSVTTKVVVEGVPLDAPVGGPPTKLHRLTSPQGHSHNGKSLVLGDEVHFDEDQASAFKDKFVPVNPSEPYKVRTIAELNKADEDNVARHQAALNKKPAR